MTAHTAILRCAHRQCPGMANFAHRTEAERLRVIEEHRGWVCGGTHGRLM